MSTPLFRPEVMQAQQGQWLGAIRIGRPPQFAVVTAGALICAAALVSFAIWGEYTNKVSVAGVLLPEGGVMNLSSPQVATVAEVLVHEGESVKAGQPLLKLRSERMLAQGELGQLQAQALQQRRVGLQTELRLAEQQAQQRAAAIGDRLRSLQSDAVTLQGELEANEQRVQLGKKTQQRFDELAASGYVSGLQAQQKQEELLDLSLRERNARRSLEAVQREQTSLQAELISNRSQLDTQRSQLQRQLASLDQEGSEIDARTGWTLTAPQAGTVSALNAVPGQSVIAGLTLVSVLPQAAAGKAEAIDPLQANLYAPSRTMGFIEPGQEVWMRYAAYPYQKFGMQRGVVQAVSKTPINPQDLPAGQAQSLMQAAQSNEPLYRVTVRLDRQTLLAYGAAQPLKSGMALDAQVQQDRRAIWEWVLEPMLAVTGGKRSEGGKT